MSEEPAPYGLDDARSVAKGVDPSCPICGRIAAGSFLAANATAVAFPDAFPLNPGHALIVPRRHVPGFFDLTGAEQLEVWTLLPEVKRSIDALHAPAGYNVGVNVGALAGQTVDHVHVHLIPRFPGDTPAPKGGVRWVIPERAEYWKGRP